VTGPDPFRLAARLAQFIESTGIRYVIGGSVAATYYGEPRATVDLDIMIEADEAAARVLVAHLQGDFYVELEDALQAVQRFSSFNAIEYASLVKVDFFVAENRDEVRTQLDRRRPVEFEGTVLWFYAPEDILVRKLAWFRMGGETSEQQWRDITGILALAPDLDQDYLTYAAERFRVGDLLARARKE
jgi:hypothetical protein